MIKFKRDNYGALKWEGQNRYGSQVCLHYYRVYTRNMWYWEALLVDVPKKHEGRTRIRGQAKTAKDAKAAVLTASGEIGVTT